ncbi:diguanylate cyclase [Cupriavidus sp. AU9028]|uniref:GGDEF domain-containing protein n=1 Tax=Cupriavidus sp. AU9028 TaxID=2871157 RepID=UPI001C989BD6|nr:GGDEF domain-containing protein [Cupriavidus sp. AU9028]MBY4897917.1 GGDEF domain-containing protein [Cupriavidus sp. AU9028]
MLPDSGTAYLPLLALFASTLGLSLGLRRRPGHSTGDRGWAGAHALASLGGMVMVICALTPSVLTIVAAHALGLAAQLRLLKTLSPSPLRWAKPARRGLPVGAVAAVLLFAVLAVSGEPAGAGHLLAVLGHSATAALAWRALWLLTGERRARAGFGHSLVAVASCAQLCAQCLFLAMTLAADSSLPPYASAADAAGLLAQAPLLLMLIALLSGMVGHALLCAERLVAEQVARARLDPLTGLLHRGALEDAALSLAARAADDATPFCCLVIDVDRFKRINDGAGHLAGDAVLRRVADAVRRASRTTDVAARFGGEEFCLLCPRTTAEEAQVLAERIRARIASIALPAELGGHASVSIGIAQARPHRDARQAWEQLFAQADRALYRAKRDGRNRVVSACADDTATSAEPWSAACIAAGG